MSVELRWLVDHSASVFHIAEVVARGVPLDDAELAQTLADAVHELQSRLDAAEVPERRFWDHLIPQSAGIESYRELASIALTKTVGRHAEDLQWDISAILAAIESAVRQLRPDLIETVTRDTRAVREGWQTQGSTLLDEIGRLTQEELLVPAATVLPVYPALGGAGAAHLLYNSVRIEVLPSDPSVELPEIVRLVWLLSQINMDVPVLSETVHGSRLPMAAALSMLPPALVAAEQMGLTAFNKNTLAAAVQAWCPDATSQDDLADIVWRWWHAFLERRPAWSVGVGALDQMLEAAGGP